MATVTCQYDDNMPHFGGMNDLRRESVSTSVSSTIFDEDLSRSIRQISHLVHDQSSSINNTPRTTPTSEHQSSANTEVSEAESGVLKSDKQSIYSHPLFPLLTLVYEKCELATCTPRDAVVGGNVSYSDLLNDDVSRFAKQMQDRLVIFDHDNELDNLMILSVQVLRFHLLELEKVHELCQNFTTRYINCLKGKMPIDVVIDDRDGGIPFRSDVESAKLSLEESFLWPETSSSNPPPVREVTHQTTGRLESINPPVHTTQGCHTSNFSYSRSTESLSPTGSALDGSPYSVEDDSDPGKKSNPKKRGIFPKQATNIMRTWLFQNLTHPYPSEEQKKILATQTGLTILQVNNWFINARRRIVQPMIDQSNKSVNNSTCHFNQDGQGMGGLLMDSQSSPVAVMHPGWPSGFQALPDVMAAQQMSMGSNSFHPASTASPTHPGYAPVPSQTMFLPSAHHHNQAAAAAAAMMMPHHAAAAVAAAGHTMAGTSHPHILQSAVNPTNIPPHMLGHSC